jgi:hypothetical protein
LARWAFNFRFWDLALLVGRAVDAAFLAGFARAAVLAVALVAAVFAAAFLPPTDFALDALVFVCLAMVPVCLGGSALDNHQLYHETGA